MGTNSILPFASTDTGTNLLTQAEYTADAQRTTGNQPGIARSKLVNKSMKQASIMASGLAQFIASYQGNDVVDTLTNAQIAEYLLNAIRGVVPVPVEVPAGSVMFISTNAAPSGYLKANGAAVSRSTYTNLFAAIGTTYGTGDGSTTFNLPDMRGEFLRGLDDGRGIDPSRALGSLQLDALQTIYGTLGMVKGLEQATSSGAFAQYFNNMNESAHSPGDRVTNGYWDFNSSRVARSASETRPRNIALLACIKY